MKYEIIVGSIFSFISLVCIKVLDNAVIKSLSLESEHTIMLLMKNQIVEKKEIAIMKKKLYVNEKTMRKEQRDRIKKNLNSDVEEWMNHNIVKVIPCNEYYCDGYTKVKLSHGQLNFSLIDPPSS